MTVDGTKVRIIRCVWTYLALICLKHSGFSVKIYVPEPDKSKRILGHFHRPVSSKSVPCWRLGPHRMVRFIDESVDRVHTLMAELVSPEFVFIFMSDNVSQIVCAAVPRVDRERKIPSAACHQIRI